MFTDLYQVTMAYGYWKSGMAGRNSIFHLYTRKNPFSGGYIVSCGLDTALEYLESFTFVHDDVEYLSTLKGNDNTPLFNDKFLDFLLNLKFECDIYAPPEGTVVFPFEPLLQVKGPLLQAQLIETPLLNIINFQSLIATKSARINRAARGEPVLEFGLRRAQGFDGALSASRAAFVGGCAATSNVLAGKLFDIPVAGTHAHSWVMAFDSEPEAFKTYAGAMPNNCILLVDTYDVIEGVKNAIETGRILKEKGKKLAGIRIDSGDLADLSQQARKLLDEAGFRETMIVASNDLDEEIVESLNEQQAKIDLLGIGTKLVTAFDQPALGAIYKLSAIETDRGMFADKIKLSETGEKINIPGQQQVLRLTKDGFFQGDIIYDERKPLGKETETIDPLDFTKKRIFRLEEYETELLLEAVMTKGKRTYKPKDLAEIKEKVSVQLAALPNPMKRLINPHIYPVGLEKELYNTRENLILQHRQQMH